MSSESKSLDQRLVDQSIAFHGHRLIDHLHECQVQVELPNFLSIPQKHQKEQNPLNNEKFHQDIVKFIANKAVEIFNKRIRPIDTRNVEMSYNLPPLELFMDVEEEKRLDEFEKSVEVGDVVFAEVVGLQEHSLILKLLATSCGKVRFIHDLRILAFCARRDIPRRFAHQDPLSDFTVKDLVRAVVVNHRRQIDVTLVQENSCNTHNVALGSVTEEDLPIHYRKMQQLNGERFEQCMQMDVASRNPGIVGVLSHQLGLAKDQHYTLMTSLRSRYLPAEYASNVAMKQSRRWSTAEVEKGIEQLKGSAHSQAMLHFNKALELDATNVDAFVARGALYANNGSYERALEDLNEGLYLDKSHRNAQKYKQKTLLALVASLMEAEEYKLAMDRLTETFALDPDCSESKDLWERCALHLREKQQKSPASSSQLSSLSSSSSSDSGSAILSTHSKLKTLMKHKSRDKQACMDSSSSDESLKDEGSKKKLYKERNLMDCKREKRKADEKPKNTENHKTKRGSASSYDDASPQHDARSCHKKYKEKSLEKSATRLKVKKPQRKRKDSSNDKRRKEQKDEKIEWREKSGSSTSSWKKMTESADQKTFSKHRNNCERGAYSAGSRGRWGRQMANDRFPLPSAKMVPLTVMQDTASPTKTIEGLKEMEDFFEMLKKKKK